MKTVGSIVGIPPEIRTFKETDKLACSQTYIGFELEAENVTKGLRLSSMWSTKEDRSLRNKGMEYVFSAPLKGEDIISALAELCAGLATFKPQFSHRCGTHVHVDVRSLTPKQLTSFVVHSLVFERALYAFSGMGRDSNIFCLPYYKANIGAGGLTSLHVDGDVQTLTQTSDKYYGINLAAIGKYGSVEFRMLPGTQDFGRMIAWVNILLAIHVAARETDNCDTLLQSMSARGVMTYARDVFRGTPEFMNYIKEQDMYSGMRLAQHYINKKNIEAARKELPSKVTEHSLISVFSDKNNIRMVSLEKKVQGASVYMAHLDADVLAMREHNMEMLQAFRPRDNIEQEVLVRRVDIEELL